jgi:hypothetical protein
MQSPWIAEEGSVLFERRHEEHQGPIEPPPRMGETNRGDLPTQLE